MSDLDESSENLSEESLIESVDTLCSHFREAYGDDSFKNQKVNQPIQPSNVFLCEPSTSEHHPPVNESPSSSPLHFCPIGPSTPSPLHFFSSGPSPLLFASDTPALQQEPSELLPSRDFSGRSSQFLNLPLENENPSSRPDQVDEESGAAPGGESLLLSSDTSNTREKRKRNNSVLSDRKKWKIAENKRKRVKGESYIGYRRANKESSKLMIHDTPKEERVLGPRCSGKVCEKWESRSCNLVTEPQRKRIHEYFWKTLTSWGEKKQLIGSLIDVRPVKQKTTAKETSRRGNTYVYHLKVGTERIPVCKQIFTSTFSLKWSTIKRWIEWYSSLAVEEEASTTSDDDNDDFDNHRDGEEEPATQDEPPSQVESPPLNEPSTSGAVARSENLRKFFENLPKLPSHYCRASSSKVYLQTDISSASQLYQLYSQFASEQNVKAFSRFKFDLEWKSQRIGIFSPRKDMCDTCYQYKVKNLSEESFQQHVTRKNVAREQKQECKKLAEEKKCYTLCCDLQAVKLVPQIPAGSLYYKMKLAVHNFTVYDLETHDAMCYFFDESQTDLTASTFASCLIDYIEALLNSKGHREVNIFSDGCTYQNRNSCIANALLHLSMAKNVVINQKYLEKGHTQMECDTVHSVLEGAIRKRDIYLPSQFIDIARSARQHPFPYRVKFLQFDFFKDFTKMMVYDSIRPGKKPGDPVVTDLRWLQYRPNGTILYSLDFTTPLRPLPARRRSVIATQDTGTFPALNVEARKIPRDKWQDLQDIKRLLPRDCQHFYDHLPYEEVSVRQTKRQSKAAAGQHASKKKTIKK